MTAPPRPRRPRRARVLLTVGALGLVAFASGAVQSASASPDSRSASKPTAKRHKKPLVCAGARIAKPGGGYWTCTFDDEFNGTKLDTTDWTPITTAKNGFTNGPECYVSSHANLAEGDGVLTLTARELPAPITCTTPGGASFTTDYTSASVSTKGHFAQDYGRFSIRAQFPPATVEGLQTSLWMYPADTAKYRNSSGEIDLGEEYSNYPDRAIPTIHYTYPGQPIVWQQNSPAEPGKVNPLVGVNENQNSFCMFADPTAFHTYTLTWSPTEMVIKYDGTTCLDDHYVSSVATSSAKSAPFDVPFFLVLTQALGKDGTNDAFTPGSTPLPATTVVDWVRAWK